MGSSRRSNARPNRGTLARIAADRTANCANGSAARRTSTSTSLRGRRRRLLHRLIGIKSRLFFRPFVAAEFILLLLCLGLPFPGIDKDVGSRERLFCHKQQPRHDEQHSWAMHVASSTPRLVFGDV